MFGLRGLCNDLRTKVPAGIPLVKIVGRMAVFFEFSKTILEGAETKLARVEDLTAKSLFFPYIDFDFLCV